MIDQGESLKQLTNGVNAVIERVNQHHEFLTGIQQQMAARASQSTSGAQGAPAASPAFAPAQAPQGGPGFNDPNAQKAADAMRLLEMGQKMLGGGETAAAVGADTYAAKLADLTLARLQSDISLTDVLKNALAQGLAQKAKGTIAGALPTFD